MKKVVAFLLALIIFVAPVTTLVKADVVIGDNDDIIMNENATILGRKLAMLESLSDLALSGVTEYTISNTNDVDAYLDSLWSEVNDAIEYLDSGEWVNDIPDKIASKYYTNLVNYRDIVNNRGQFLGFDLQNPATSLLSTYFANDTYGKRYTSTGLYETLDMVRALSDLNRNTPHPSPNPDFSAICSSLAGYVYKSSDSGGPWYCDFSNTSFNYQIMGGYGPYVLHPQYPFSIVRNIISTWYFTDIGTVRLNSDGNGGYNALYVFPYKVAFYNNNQVASNYSASISFRNLDSNRYSQYLVFNTLNTTNQDVGSNAQTHFDGLSIAMNYLYDHFYHINLYVDDVLWVNASSDVSSFENLEIDGFLKIYGNDYPQQYKLEPNTKLDYDQLYQVIYNAIRDNLPISQGDINYYDSHDTIYSPTIINNYGEDKGDESDLIDTILDYAVIPKFDTAIAQPMRAALTNGVVIMQNSITNVIPDEILLVLGACFFLLLFAVVINRMIK